MGKTASRKILHLLAASVVLALAGCAGSAAAPAAAPALRIGRPTHAETGGTPISLKPFPAAAYGSLMPAGQRMYSLRYWSRGLDVQGYLDAPSGKGPFPILVYLHGGDPAPEPGHWTGFPVYAAKTAVESSNAHSIVFIPNYGGYGPSGGAIRARIIATWMSRTA